MARRSFGAGSLRSGFSLVEVLVALGILTAGLMALAASYPLMLDTGRKAELLTVGAALAQQKAEEIRRHDTATRLLITTIQNRTTPTSPIVFPNESRLEYSFSGKTVMFAKIGNPSDPRALNGVARVLIRYAPSYKPTEDVIYELRLN